MKLVMTTAAVGLLTLLLAAFSEDPAKPTPQNSLKVEVGSLPWLPVRVLSLVPGLYSLMGLIPA